MANYEQQLADQVAALDAQLQEHREDRKRERKAYKNRRKAVRSGFFKRQRIYPQPFFETPGQTKPLDYTKEEAFDVAQRVRTAEFSRNNLLNLGAQRRKKRFKMKTRGLLKRQVNYMPTKEDIPDKKEREKVIRQRNRIISKTRGASLDESLETKLPIYSTDIGTDTIKSDKEYNTLNLNGTNDIHELDDYLNDRAEHKREHELKGPATRQMVMRKNPVYGRKMLGDDMVTGLLKHNEASRKALIIPHPDPTKKRLLKELPINPQAHLSHSFNWNIKHNPGEGEIENGVTPRIKNKNPKRNPTGLGLPGGKIKSSAYGGGISLAPKLATTTKKPRITFKRKRTEKKLPSFTYTVSAMNRMKKEAGHASPDLISKK